MKITLCIPSIKDPNLGVQLVSSDELESPNSMAFLGPENILVLEKNKGTAQRIVNVKRCYQVLSLLFSATEVARCMCGVAVSKSDNGTVPESLLSIATKVSCFFLGFSCLRV